MSLTLHGFIFFTNNTRADLLVYYVCPTDTDTSSAEDKKDRQEKQIPENPAFK